MKKPNLSSTEHKTTNKDKLHQQLPVTSQVGRRWLSSSLWSRKLPSVMTSKLRMNMITTPSSFFTGTTSTMHRKQCPAWEERGREMRLRQDGLHLVKAFIHCQRVYGLRIEIKTSNPVKLFEVTAYMQQTASLHATHKLNWYLSGFVSKIQNKSLSKTMPCAIWNQMHTCLLQRMWTYARITQAHFHKHTHTNTLFHSP